MTFELFFLSKLISFLANDEVVGALPNRYLNVSVNCCREIDFLIGKSWPHFHFFLKNVLEKLGFEEVEIKRNEMGNEVVFFKLFI